MSEPSAKAGLAARSTALQLWLAVTRQGLQLEQALADKQVTKHVEGRDLALAHAIVAAALRRLGELSACLDGLLAKPLPRSAGITRDILILGLAQLLALKASAPAAINLSVELAKQDRNARHFSNLVNAVLREADRRQPALAAPLLNMPDWLRAPLQATYGEAATLAIAAAHTLEAATDITPKSDAAAWAGRMQARLLPQGSIRLAADAPSVAELPGYAEGEWWVQDAAAALPVKLLESDLSGKSALDLCAAPGGKTAQLASQGARVTAVDISKSRMQRLSENMQRLRLDVDCRVKDMRQLPETELYDIVLLDAPCSATGTMRRHPDLAHLKSSSQLGKLAEIQATLLRKSATLVKPGGTLLYCVCSLLAEEGEHQVSQFLSTHQECSVEPAQADCIGGQSQFITDRGFLRTLPAMAIGESAGLDGFFAALLVRH